MPMYNDGSEILSAFANSGEEQCFGYVNGLLVYTCDHGEPPPVTYEWVPNLRDQE